MPPTVRAIVAVIALLVVCVGSMVSTAAAASRGPISDETPPATCDPGWFVSEVVCTGRYCDNITITCRRFPGAAVGVSSWTGWISDEGRRGECPSGSIIAGFACNGAYCDNVSLYCVQVMNLRQHSCAFTEAVSEEGGGRLLLSSNPKLFDKAGQIIFANLMTCQGSYCDNKSFRICEFSIPR